MEAQNTKGVIFLGDAGVGKTTIIHKQRNETVDPAATISTDSFPITVNGVDLLLYDTAGQERFRSTATFFYNKASVAVVVYDVNNLQSFQDLDYWINSLHDYIDQIKLILVGNKTDLAQSFDTEEIKKLAEQNNCTYVLTSAKTGAGIEDLFNLIAESASEVNASIRTEDTIDLNQDSNKKNNCC